MGRKPKEVKEVKVKAVKEEVITDILEERFKDEEGTEKVRRTHLNADGAVVKEEVLTA